MKRISRLLLVFFSFFLSVSIFTNYNVHAALISVSGIEDGAFLERLETYYFTVASNQNFKNFQMRCSGHYAQSDSLVSLQYINHDYTPPTTITSGEYIWAYAIRDLAPYYDPSTGQFVKNNMVFDLTHGNNSHSIYSIQCNVIGQDLSDYYSQDTTFYYNSPTDNSFISSKTLPGLNISQNNYNCLAYSLHEENNGWLWPFSNATTAEVSYWFYGEGYTQNLNTNHDFSHIIAYGKYDSNIGGNKILHFAKVTDWSSNGTPIEINSKWGGYEVIHSTEISPFTATVDFGTPLLYFNKVYNNNDSICYNSYTNTYYDSNYKTWNSSTHSYDYIDVLYSSSRNVQNSISPNKTKSCSEKLNQIYQQYRNRIEEYENNIPYFGTISYVITDDEKGAAKELISASIPYLDQIVDIATQQGYENFDSRTAQFIINNILDINIFYSNPDRYLSDIKEQLRNATVSVEKYGASLNVNDCQMLQKKYGYLIIPALKNIDKLDCLHIADADYCHDIDILLAICECIENHRS